MWDVVVFCVCMVFFFYFFFLGGGGVTDSQKRVSYFAKRSSVLTALVSKLFVLFLFVFVFFFFLFEGWLG